MARRLLCPVASAGDRLPGLRARSRSGADAGTCRPTTRRRHVLRPDLRPGDPKQNEPMSRRTLQVDDALYQYVIDQSIREHPAQQALRAATAAHPHGGMGARRAIEVGVFTGYSALTVALALPDDGTLLACDISDEYTRVGRLFWEQAGVAHKIELRLAPARTTLEACLFAGEAGHYDFAFIDADKAGYDAYYECCLQLLRPGGLIAIDNTLWSGKVARPAVDADTVALQQLNAKLHDDPRVDLSLLPIGDGLTLARKR